ncbi:MAG: 3-phosphoshikimate 1-carboxyvinyltransferase [bacterium]
MIWKVTPSGPLSGEIEVPGDKSITHRGYIFGAMAHGRTVVSNPLIAEDTESTLKAVTSFGVQVERKEGAVVIYGEGKESLTEPGDLLDMGNSGTGVRLLAGLLSGCSFFSVLTGDTSLRSRPMARIVEPLRMMGAAVDGRGEGNLLPLCIRGGGLKGIRYTSPVASAQIKSCILIAALSAVGQTVFTEPSLSRDHTERIMEHTGISFGRDGNTLILDGGQSPSGAEITVPGDISSAAFFLVAAAVLKGSSVTVRNVGINPTRTGLLDLLEAMDVRIDINEQPESGSEPVADITVTGTGSLKGLDVPVEWIPRIIDEIPLVAVVAAAAEGRTVIRGAEELRVKESDRIASTVRMLRRAGVDVSETADGFVVEGGADIRRSDHDSNGDHRIAMASVILSLMGSSSSTVVDTACAATSFPGFTDSMNSLAPGTITEAAKGEQ